LVDGTAKQVGGGQGEQAMRAATMAAVLSVIVVTSGFSAEKAKKPRLDLRASPRIAFSPVNVLLTAELTGGDDVEDLHCPAVHWDWDDGAKSSQESDCEPMESGGSLERRYTAFHAYRQAGTYTVKITMTRANRTVAVASTTIDVKPGLGDTSAE
jgi:PKD repeat protein